jgi:hypothetical protein
VVLTGMQPTEWYSGEPGMLRDRLERLGSRIRLDEETVSARVCVRVRVCASACVGAGGVRERSGYRGAPVFPDVTS